MRTLLDTGQIDLLNTTIGDGGASYARAIPNYRYDEAPNIPVLARLRKAVTIDIPVVGVGRILSPAVAESVLQSGVADLVAMTRPHRRPRPGHQVRSGAAHRVRPCVGGNVCVNRKLQGYPEISCLHNPEVLREAELAPQPTENPRSVLVVGAGPADLKATEIAASRGHRVTIVDAGNRPDGRLRAAETTAARPRLHDRPPRRRAERARCRRPQRHHRGRRPAGRGGTGSRDRRDRGRPRGAASFPDAAPGLVLDSAEALAGRAGQRVLVYDPVGADEGPLVAEALPRGVTVTFVTSCETVMPWGGNLHRYEIPGILRRRCESVVTGALLGDVDGKHVLVVRPDGETLLEAEVDTVVDVSSPVPVLDLVPVLEKRGIPFTVVGDASAPRTAMHAFKEGHEAALAL